MFFTDHTSLHPAISIHKIGNKGSGESLFLSDQPSSVSEELTADLLQYFSSGFKQQEYYRFYHDTSLSMNEVYQYASDIFEDPECLHQRSMDIAKHLYNQSLHPKIKSGEFYVAYFKEVAIEGITCDAIGLFKSEDKDVYLEVKKTTTSYHIDRQEGINIDKAEKGCIIFNREAEEGYIVALTDRSNRGTEAMYWKDDFLGLMIMNNDYHQTQQFLHIAKQYVTQQLTEEFEVEKADQIDLLNRSVAYFKENETFEKDDFVKEVFYDEKVMQSFRQFDQQCQDELQIRIDDSFTISDQAVKKQSRIFKSVLKLDKNFHIYIHGNREMIQQGVDENGKKYYKLYYENES